MEKKPISVQLYSLREEAKRDFPAVIKSVAEMGYKGVEPAGLHGMSTKEFRKMVEDAGMVVSSNHGPWPTRENLSEVVDTAGALGTDLVVCGFGRDVFKDLDAIKQSADTANFILEKVNAAGFRLAVHNHWWEFCMIDGRLGYDIFMERCPGLLCELDVYWAQNFNECDAAEQVDKYKAVTPLLHIKDGPLERDKAMTALGTGKLDIPRILKAADPKVLEWIVVELDRCDTDMTEAIAASYRHMIDNGLALGNK
jgi:sugar phosphate isomerase/epimerase